MATRASTTNDTPLTMRIKRYSDSYANVKNSFAETLSSVVGFRMNLAIGELNALADVLGAKQLNEKHVAYAWSVAMRLPMGKGKAAKQLQKGGEVLPMEYFLGPNANTNYFDKDALVPFETDLTVTSKFTRPEIPIKELIMSGGAGPEFFNTEVVAAIVGAQAQTKITPAGQAALRDRVNSYAGHLLTVMKQHKPTAKQLEIVSRS
jgi:hypothetical protein